MESGGVRLLKLYNFSPSAIVMAVMNDHNWNQWKFNKSHAFSSSLQYPGSLKSYLSFLEEQMQIEGVTKGGRRRKLADFVLL